MWKTTCLIIAEHDLPILAELSKSQPVTACENRHHRYFSSKFQNADLIHPTGITLPHSHDDHTGGLTLITRY